MLLAAGLFIFLAVLVMAIVGTADPVSKRVAGGAPAKVQIKRTTQDSTEGLARHAEMALRRNEIERGLFLLQQAIDGSATKQERVHYLYQYYRVLRSVQPEQAKVYWEEHGESFRQVLGKRETGE